MPSLENTVLLVDAHTDFVSSVEQNLEARGFGHLCATNVQQACNLLVALQHTKALVSCVVIDLDLPDGPGEQVLTHAASAFPHAKVITLAESLTAPRACGLLGRSTHLPRSGLTPEAFVDVLLRGLDRNIATFAAALSLSKREFMVLLCIIEGLSIADMAARLRCKASTVKTYAQRIYNKAQRGSQTEVLGLLILWLTTPSLELFAQPKKPKQSAA